jgi:hypothetical protein
VVVGWGVDWGVGLKVVTLSKKVVTFLWERKGLYGKERDTGVNGKGCESITISLHTPFFYFITRYSYFQIEHMQ